LSFSLALKQHRTARMQPEDPTRTHARTTFQGTDKHTQNRIGYLVFDTSHIGNTPSVPSRCIRPASRDLSDGARSGNTSRHATP